MIGTPEPGQLVWVTLTHINEMPTGWQRQYLVRLGDTEPNIVAVHKAAYLSTVQDEDGDPVYSADGIRGSIAYVEREELRELRRLRQQREEIEEQIRELVSTMGWATWQQIGNALGVSRQSAHERYAADHR